MYLRHSSFYFWYFAALGAMLPYWGLYLKSRGFGAAEIGELFAVMMATKVIAPVAWGWLADHTGRRMAIVRVASILAVVAFSGVFYAQGFGWMVVVVAAFSFFWNAALPQFEAVTMSRLGDRPQRYSSIRLWGSIGFVIAVVAIGAVFDRHGASLLPVVLLVLFMAIWLSTLAVPEIRSAPASDERASSLWSVLRRREVVLLLAVCFFLQASHGPYYSFFSIHLEAHDYSGWLIGQLWALGVIAEIGVFLLMHRLQPRFGARNLLLASLALTTLRWVLIALFIDSLAVMIVAQILHAASFGVYHAVAIGLIHELFRGRHQGRGQALYSSVSFGAGGAAGSLYAGYLWEGAGPDATFLLAAVASLIALVIATCGLRRAPPV